MADLNDGSIEPIEAGDELAEGRDLAAENRRKLAELFPGLVTESVGEDGQTVLAIDADALRDLVGATVDHETREKFGLSWHGKSAARRLALTPSVGTLRPAPEESVDWDTTGNVVIEGDNLEVLKLLQKSYAGRVKLIYIDPPYNTGKDFVYKDNFRDPIGHYQRVTGQRGEEGERLTSNPESGGRYHTDWLNMIYPRLLLARELLEHDGVMFVSVGEGEVHNLRSCCDNIFGGEHFVAQFAWRTDGNFDNQAKVKSCHEYILLYSRDVEAFPHPPVVDPSIPRTSKLYEPEIRNTIVKNGPRNPVSDVILPEGFPVEASSGTYPVRNDAWPHYKTTLQVEDGRLVAAAIASSGWSSKALLDQFIANDCQPVKDAKGQETRFAVAQSLAIEAVKVRSDRQSHVISLISGLGGSQKGNAEVVELEVPFTDYPKPTALLRYLTKMTVGDDFIVLDFFAGSGTTGHAVMAQNAADGGNRRYVLVQLPEPTGREDYPTIADLTKERLRRAGAKICEEHAASLLDRDVPLDTGFRVFKLDTANVKAWEAPTTDELQPEEAESLIAGAVDAVKADRTDADLLWGVMLNLGLPPDGTVTAREIDGKTVHVAGSGALLACFDRSIDRPGGETLAIGLAEILKDLGFEGESTVVLRDSAFAGDDAAKVNLVENLRQRLLEGTTARVRSL